MKRRKIDQSENINKLRLPADVFFKIFLYLDLEDLNAITLTCVFFSRLVYYSYDASSGSYPQQYFIKKFFKSRYSEVEPNPAVKLAGVTPDEFDAFRAELARVRLEAKRRTGAGFSGVSVRLYYYLGNRKRNRDLCEQRVGEEIMGNLNLKKEKFEQSSFYDLLLSRAESVVEDQNRSKTSLVVAYLCLFEVCKKIPNFARAFRGLGLAEDKLAEYEATEEDKSQRYESAKQWFGSALLCVKNVNDKISILVCLGKTLWHAKEYAEAEEQFEAARDSYYNETGYDPPEQLLPTIMLYLAVVNFHLGQFESAKSFVNDFQDITIHRNDEFATSYIRLINMKYEETSNVADQCVANKI